MLAPLCGEDVAPFNCANVFVAPLYRYKHGRVSFDAFWANWLQEPKSTRLRDLRNVKLSDESVKGCEHLRPQFCGSAGFINPSAAAALPHLRPPAAKGTAYCRLQFTYTAAVAAETARTANQKLHPEPPRALGTTGDA